MIHRNEGSKSLTSNLLISSVGILAGVFIGSSDGGDHPGVPVRGKVAR